MEQKASVRSVECLSGPGRMKRNPPVSLDEILADPGRVRRLVLPRVAARTRALGADEEDVLQDVLLGLLEAQRRPGSRYDGERGRSPASYVHMVGVGAAHNSLRRTSRWSGEAEPLGASRDEDGAVTEPADPRSAVEGDPWREIVGLLDLPEEREMAANLAAGMSISEAGRAMGLTSSRAWELGTRVRSLLLPLLD